MCEKQWRRCQSTVTEKRAWKAAARKQETASGTRVSVEEPENSCLILALSWAAWLHSRLKHYTRRQHFFAPGNLCTNCRLHDAWGVTRLCQQDGFQEHYAQTGRYPGPMVTTPRRPWALINWLFWACLLLYPLCLILVQLIQSGSLTTILATVVVCVAGWCHSPRPQIGVTMFFCI